jgi:hypothetical protein
MLSVTKRFSLLALLCILPFAGAGAQSGTSSALAGTVTDKTGALIPNATVTATDLNTKTARTGETDASGHYLLSQINPATYQITVNASGFGIASSEATPVGVGRTVTVNFTLSVSSASQSVEVTAQQGLLSLDKRRRSRTFQIQGRTSLSSLSSRRER